MNRQIFGETRHTRWHASYAILARLNGTCAFRRGNFHVQPARNEVAICKAPAGLKTFAMVCKSTLNLDAYAFRATTIRSNRSHPGE